MGVIMMGLAWLVLAPAGVIVARHGKATLGAPRWLQLHRGSQLLVVLLTVAGIAVAAAAADEEKISHFHSTHSMLGMAIGALVVLQAAGGISTGQNMLGKALMALRDEARA